MSTRDTEPAIDDEVTAVYPPSFAAVVEALRGAGPDDWPPLSDEQADMDAPQP